MTFRLVDLIPSLSLMALKLALEGSTLLQWTSEGRARRMIAAHAVDADSGRRGRGAQVHARQ